MIVNSFYSKDELSEVLLDTLAATQTCRGCDLNVIRRAVFMERRHQASGFTLDGFEPLPECAQDIEPPARSPSVVFGKVIDQWVLPRRRSFDGHEYKIIAVLPCKCRQNTEGRLVMVQEFPEFEQTSVLLQTSVPCVMRNKKIIAKLTDVLLAPAPRRAFYLILRYSTSSRMRRRQILKSSSRSLNSSIVMKVIPGRQSSCLTCTAIRSARPSTTSSLRLTGCQAKSSKPWPVIVPLQAGHAEKSRRPCCSRTLMGDLPCKSGLILTKLKGRRQGGSQPHLQH